MDLVLGIVAFMLVAFLLGKRVKDFGPREWAILILIALAQVGMILLYAYTKQPPPPL